MELAWTFGVRPPKRLLLAALALGSLFGLEACGGNVQVTRVVTVKEATSGGGKLTPVAVVKEGGERVVLPPGARVEAERVRLAADHEHKLGEGDVLETDESGRIVAVRDGAGRTTHFVPGTASSPDGSDVVRGQLAGDAAAIPLTKADRVEVAGSFGPDEAIPGGGRVETQRATALLVGGTVVLGLAWAPMVYVGATSTNTADRALLVPVAGPFIDLATRSSCTPPPGSEVLPVDPCIGETATRVGLVIGGAFQGLGALMLAFGLPAKSRVVYDGDRGVATRAWPAIRVAPAPGGAAVLGSF